MVPSPDPPVRAAFGATLGFVLGLVGAVLYAMGFGRINGRDYELLRVSGYIACYCIYHIICI